MQRLPLLQEERFTGRLRNDAYLPGERFAVDYLKSKVLIRLGAMEFTEAYQVGSIELIDDRLYYVFLMDDRLLCGKGNGCNE